MEKSVFAKALVIALAGAVLLLGSCVSSPTTAEKDAFRKEVDAIFKVWGDTSLNPNLEGFVGIWDEKMVKMASGKVTVRGPAALRQAKAKAFETVTLEKFVVNIEETQLAGDDLGWAMGTYILAMRPKAGGDLIVDEGMFLTVFMKQPDGSWKVYRDTMMTGARP